MTTFGARWLRAVILAALFRYTITQVNRIHPQGISIMQEASLQFLKNLLLTPSPSGFERPIQDVVRAWARPLTDEVRTDRHGNVLAVLNPEGQPRVMLAG